MKAKAVAARLGRDKGSTMRQNSCSRVQPSTDRGILDLRAGCGGKRPRISTVNGRVSTEWTRINAALSAEEAEGLDQQIERHGERDRGHQPAHHDRHERASCAAHAGKRGRRRAEHDIDRHHGERNDHAVDHASPALGGRRPRSCRDWRRGSRSCAQHLTGEDVAVVVVGEAAAEPVGGEGEQRLVRDHAAEQAERSARR